MEYQSNETETGVTVMRVSGMLTRGSKGEQFEWALEQLISDGARKLIIDLSAVPYVDSAGLGILVGTVGKMNKAGGKLRVAGLNDRVMQVVKLTQVDRVLSVDQDVEASSKALGATA